MSFSERRVNVVVLLLGMILSAWAAVSLNQVVTWDLRNYHLYSGYAFLNKPLHYDFAPGQIQSFFNPLLHVPTYLALEHLPGSSALALLGAIQGINIFLIFRISQSLLFFMKDPLRTLLSICCAITGFYGAANIGELGTTFADNILSVLVLWSLLLLIQFLLRDKTANRPFRLRLVTAGILFGAALGLKLNIAPYALAACVGLLAATLVRREGIRPVLAFSAGIVLAFICVYGFWGTVLYLEYKNPFFPYLNNIFKSPYYDLVSARDPRFLPQTWQQLLFYPFFFAHRNRLVCEMIFRDARFAMCYIAIALVTIFFVIRTAVYRSRKQQERNVSAQGPCLLFLILFFVISYIGWQQQFSIYRYLIPLEFLAPLFIGLIVTYILRNPLYAVPVSLLVNVLIYTSVVPIDFGERGIAYNSLKFTPPHFEDLDKSIVLMTGDLPTSYITLQFPATTRFIRIASNFLNPGQNPKTDTQIRRTLASYPMSRTLTYIAGRDQIQLSQQQLSHYGLSAYLPSCIELRSASKTHGFLCRAFDGKNSDAAGQMLNSPDLLRIAPPLAISGQDTIHFQYNGINTEAIDIIYELNGRKMPPIRMRLDSNGAADIPVGAESEKGTYHMVSVRDATRQGDWIKIDISAQIR